MIRWVVKGNEELAIVTTSGFEPPDCLCQAKDDWTIYNISYDSDKKVVYYDPEKQMRIEQQKQAEEKRRAKEEYVVHFKQELTRWQDAFITKRFSWFELVALGVLSNIAVQLVSTFIKGFH